MANRWGTSGNSGRLYFRGLQNHCRWWLHPWNQKTLTLWKEIYDQPRQHIEKQRHNFVNKGLSSQGYDFSCGHVWMWELDYKENWAPKNSCFWTVVLEKTLECSLDERRSNQPILKEISPEYSFERLMLKLKPQYFGHLMQRADSLKRTWCWERLRAGGERDDRGWDGWMASPTQWTWVWVNSGSWWWTGRPGVLQFMGSQRIRHNWATEQTNWTVWFPKPFILCFPSTPLFISLSFCRFFLISHHFNTEVP